jgi:hypothetical protein
MVEVHIIEQEIMRPDRQGAEHYAGYGGPLAIVTNEDFEVAVYCVGEMRIVLDDERIRDTERLHRAGYDTDEKVSELYDEDAVVNNPWFELSVDGEFGSYIYHEALEALEAAKVIAEEGA